MSFPIPGSLLKIYADVADKARYMIVKTGIASVGLNGSIVIFK